MALFPRPLSASFVDHLIWNIGLAKTPPDERNFLRAIHHQTSLMALMAYLSVLRTGQAMRLTSAWVDRHPQAHPHTGAFNCELGDLLIVWRLLDRKGGVLRRVGWMLQAKMADDAQVMAHRDKSSVNEYALYENGPHWDFDVRHHAQHLGRFNLATDADLDPTKVLPDRVRHWNYLQIRKPGTTSMPAWRTPLQWRWDSRLAGGPWQRTCMAFVPDTWSTPGLAAHMARSGAIAADFPQLLPTKSWSAEGFHAFATGADGPDGPERGVSDFDPGEGGFGVLAVDSVLPGQGDQG